MWSRCVCWCSCPRCTLRIPARNFQCNTCRAVAQYIPLNHTSRGFCRCSHAELRHCIWPAKSDVSLEDIKAQKGANGCGARVVCSYRLASILLCRPTLGILVTQRRVATRSKRTVVLSSTMRQIIIAHLRIHRANRYTATCIGLRAILWPTKFQVG